MSTFIHAHVGPYVYKSDSVTMVADPLRIADGDENYFIVLFVFRINYFVTISNGSSEVGILS